MPAPSSHSRHADRNVRLDPQGIYGTRSARRQSQLRRRRQAQNAVLWGLGIIAGLALVRWALQPRTSIAATGQSLQLPFRPASAPLAASGPNGVSELFFTSQSGGLWRARTQNDEPISSPIRLHRGAVAPAASPLLTANQIFWPGGDGKLSALNRATGQEQWSAELTSTLIAQPALVKVGSRFVVVAGDDTGHLAAFEAKSGALVWKKSLGGALGAGIGVLSPQNALPNAAPSKAPGAGLLVPLLPGGATRGGLVCLDATTGALRWRFPSDARSQSAGTATPATLGSRVFWCNDEGAIFCFEGLTGRKIWKRFAARSPNGPDAPLVMLRGAPVVARDAGVVAVGGNDGELRAFDLETGAPRWSQNLGGPLRFAAQNLVFEGKNALLATGDSAAIHIFDARDGTLLRRWSTPLPNSYGVALRALRAYSLAADGHLQVAVLQ